MQGTEEEQKVWEESRGNESSRRRKERWGKEGGGGPRGNQGVKVEGEDEGNRKGIAVRRPHQNRMSIAGHMRFYLVKETLH